jgi:hypothetical protein
MRRLSAETDITPVRSLMPHLKQIPITIMNKTPVFPKTLHEPRPTPATTKPQKRENTFSKSRDTREDRGTREMKTTHNAQTLPHGHNSNP